MKLLDEMGRHIDRIENYVPYVLYIGFYFVYLVIWLVIWLLLFLPRLGILLLLPVGAEKEEHPLHKVRKGVVFNMRDDSYF